MPYRNWIKETLFIACITITSALAVPFILKGSISWEEMNPLLLMGTVTAAFGILCHAFFTYSLRDALLLFALSFFISWLAEYAGMHWGIPFGEIYHYDEHLTPVLLGGVPLFIAISWFVLIYPPLIFLRNFVSDEQNRVKHRWLLKKASLCALPVTASDLFLDPLATSVGAWIWSGDGGYFGVPVENFLGWFLVGFIIYLCYFMFMKFKEPFSKNGKFSLDAILVAFSILLTTLANITLVQRVKSLMPLLMTLLTLGPFWTYWFVMSLPMFRKHGNRD